MITTFQIQRASLYDPRRLLIEGQVLNGEIELALRLFLRRRKFIVDAITQGNKSGLQSVKAGNAAALLLRSVAPVPIPQDLVRFAHGQTVQFI